MTMRILRRQRPPDSVAAVEQEAVSQKEVRDWFDRVYNTQGLGYLRPPEAYPIFLRMLGARAGQSLLDVACGPGLLLRAAVYENLNAQGVDISPVAVAMVPQVAPGAFAVASNAESLPFPDHLFDYVTCIGAVERFLNREKALGEMRRVAKPGARFCIMVRNSRAPSWRLAVELLNRKEPAGGRQGANTLEAWTDLFKRSGFVIEKVLPDQWFRQRLRRLFRFPSKGEREGVARPILSLRLAGELIFIMRVSS
jgi:ubiquinone/menaquinone biosynthesis C-methylase UbiE